MIGCLKSGAVGVGSWSTRLRRMMLISPALQFQIRSLILHQNACNQGLTGNTDLKLLDYRDLNQKFDKIISIEMFEAVGEKYWPIYFNKIGQSLKKAVKQHYKSLQLMKTSFHSIEIIQILFKDIFFQAVCCHL